MHPPSLRVTLVAALLAALPAVLPAAALRAQAPDSARLTIRHDSAAPRMITGAALRALPRVTVTATGHGQTHRYTGVPLATLLAHAGAWPGADTAPGTAAGTARARGNLRGAALAKYVLISASDGYRAVLALAELDSATVATAPGGPVLLADTMDGRPLPADAGPFRLVVPRDRRPARSVRQVIALEVRTAP